jgi:diguanylate cyclase (GGDEF)-like protein
VRKISPATRWLHDFGLALGEPAVVAFSLAVVAVVAVLDALSGTEPSLAPLYLFPVAFTAWYGSRSSGLILAGVAAVAAGLEPILLRPELGPMPGLARGVLWVAVGAWTTLLLARLRHAVDRLRQLAGTDHLTGLANMRSFHSTLSRAIEARRESRAPLSLVTIDLDDFKVVNDRFGHLEGDRLLTEVAAVMRDSLPPDVTIARLGGDEIAVLITGAEARVVASLLFSLRRRLLARMKQEGWPVTFSIGSITATDEEIGADRLLKLSDDLMYEAKRQGKDTILCLLDREIRDREPVLPGHPEGTQASRPSEIRPARSTRSDT